jgi:hypothetical protein
MASIPVVSGGSQPVFAVDQLNGPQLAANVTYAPAGVPVNFQGPKLEFFGMNLSGGNTNPFNQAGVGGAIELLLQTVQQVSTVAMYQVSNTVANTNFSLATFPVGAFNTDTTGGDNSAVNLAALIGGLGNAQLPNGSSYDFTGTDVFSVGFRLASSATLAS